MRIEIATRLIPYSHTPGMCSLIPQTEWAGAFFPAMVHVRTMRGPLVSCTHILPIRGPVQDFTIMLDLEKGAVRVHGKGQDGYFRYRVNKKNSDLVLEWEKSPVAAQDIILAKGCVAFPTPIHSRLSLGMHKQLDWDLVLRRADLKEIFPVLLRLSEWIPNGGMISADGQKTLFDLCRLSVEEKQVRTKSADFNNLLTAAFRGILTPTLYDDLHQGFPAICSDQEKSPLSLLSSIAELIRSLFFQQDGDDLFLLPCLPVDFDAGRFLGLQTLEGDHLEMEWSKKLLRRAIIRPIKTREVSLVLQKPLKAFRARTNLKDKGRMIDAGIALKLKADQPLYLDRFQK